MKNKEFFEAIYLMKKQCFMIERLQLAVLKLELLYAGYIPFFSLSLLYLRQHRSVVIFK